MSPYTALTSYRQLANGEANAAARPQNDNFGLALSILTYKAITAVEDAVTGTVKALRAWRLRRASIDALHALDDRTLRDIGLHRGEINSVVNDLIDGGPAAAARRQRAAPVAGGPANDNRRDLAA